jgi:hypothetical protein
LAAKESTIGILDAAVALQETAEFEGSKVDVPDSIIDFLQTNVITGTNGGNIDSVVLPADTAIGADIAHFKAIRIFQGRYVVGHRSQRACS